MGVVDGIKISDGLPFLQQENQAVLSERIFDLAYLYVIWFSCPYCKEVQEIDGDQKAPEFIRNKIYEQNGKWMLSIDLSDKKQLSITLKRMREILDLSVDELKHYIARNVFDTVGTRIEIEAIERKIDNSGIKYSISKLN